MAQAGPGVEMFQEDRNVGGERLGQPEEVLHGIPGEDQLRHQVVRRGERELVVLGDLSVRVEQGFQDLSHAFEVVAAHAEHLDGVAKQAGLVGYPEPGQLTLDLAEGIRDHLARPPG